MHSKPYYRALLLTGLGLLGFLPCGCRKKAEEAPEVAVTVQVAHSTEGPISEEIAADAILAPLSQAAIAPRISAPIRAEYVQRGSHVYRGQVLITLEDRDLQGSALESQGALASTQATYTTTVEATIPEEVKKAELDVTNLKAALDVAARTSAERRKLFTEGALSGRDADTAFAAEVQARANYDAALKHRQAVLETTSRTGTAAAQGQLTSARGRAESAQAQVSYATLRSPIDGIVTDRPLFPGETASAGSSIITVMDTSSLLAKLHLAQAVAQRLSLGHKAEVHVAGIDEPVEATVSFISPALDPGSTTVEVWLKLPNAEGRLKVGTPVHVQIAGNTVAKALQIPTAAILPAPDGGTAVMVVGTDGLAHRHLVTVGIRTAEAVQVLSGLAPGDAVITEGGYGLDDATKVTIGQPGGSRDAN